MQATPSGLAVDRLLTLDEVKDRIGSSRKFVERLWATRQLRGVKLGPKMVRIYASSVEGYLADHTVEATG